VLVSLSMLIAPRTDEVTWARLAHPASAAPATPRANTRIISRRDWSAASGVISLAAECTNPDE